MAKTLQDEIIELVEDAQALNGEMKDCHRVQALRGRNLPTDVLDELRRDEQARKQQHGILIRLRQLVGKRSK